MSKSHLLRNIIIVARIIIVSILLIVLLGCIITQVYLPEPIIIQTAYSPNGKYIAYVFESNGGITTGFIYHVSVLPIYEKFGKGNGIVYINRSIPPNNIEWLSNNELYIDDYKSTNTTKQRQSINGIQISYCSLS